MAWAHAFPYTVGSTSSSNRCVIALVRNPSPRVFDRAVAKMLFVASDVLAAVGWWSMLRPSR